MRRPSQPRQQLASRGPGGVAGWDGDPAWLIGPAGLPVAQLVAGLGRPWRTRQVVMAATHEREVDSGRGKKKKRQQPVDAVVPPGTSFVAMTAEPLIVLVPR